MPVVVRLVELEQPRLAEHAESRASTANDQAIYSSRFESKEQQVKDFLQRMPAATPVQVAHEVQYSERTAIKWMSKRAKK